MTAPGQRDSTLEGIVMPMPTQVAFLPNDSMGLDDLMALNHVKNGTLFRNPKNVQEWAVSSANGQALDMNIYAAQHVNPMDISRGVASSFPFDSVVSQEDPFISQGPLQTSQHNVALSGIDTPVFGRASPHASEFSIRSSLSFEDIRSDAPSLEWGPSTCDNSSSDDSQSSNVQLDYTPATEGFSTEFLEEFLDTRSAHFHLGSNSDAVSSPDVLGRPASLCSPSMDSVEFASDFSPTLLPLSGSTGASCVVSGTLMAYEPSFGEDFMSQFGAEGQAFLPDASYISSDASTTMQDQCSDTIFTPVDGSMSAGFPYSSVSSTGTFMPRRWNADGDGIGARSNHLYHVTAGPDGLFHCPFENTPEGCKHRPDKLKCNYDKHLDSHLKPYRCNEPDPECTGKQFSSTACLLRHQRERHAMHGHGDRPFMCHYPGCDRAQPGNGFPRHWNLNDHMKRVHNFVVEAPPKTTKGRKGADLTHASRTRIQKRTRTVSS